MTTRTPGPWRWNPDFHEVQDSEGGYCIAVVMAMWKPDEPEAEVNGRLIAAAPELLETLKTCVAHIRAMTHDFDDPEDEAPELVAADALIAKAEGRQP